MTQKQRFLRRVVLVSVCLLIGLGFPYAFSFDPGVPLAMAIKEADRIVIRNGGHDCCGNDVDSQEIFVEITDAQVIEEFSQNFNFKRQYPSMGTTVSACSCCGYPGIDFYRDGKRIALTSIQHGTAVRWAGFDGDVNLSLKSAQWLASFLDSHKVPKTQPITEAPADRALEKQE